MRTFVLAASAVYGVLAVWAIVWSSGALNGGGLLFAALISSWATPTLTTWLVAEAVQGLSPRRLLHRGLRLPVRRVVLGVIAGTTGAAIGVVGMALLDRFEMPDVVPMSVGGAISTTLACVTAQRVRKGTCLHCGYSFAGATPVSRGVCTECGVDLLAQ